MSIKKSIILFFLKRFKTPRDIARFGFKRHKDKTLLITPTVSLTYGAIENRSLALTEWLHQQGIGKGKFVFVMVADPVVQIEWFATAYESGITLSTFSTTKELEAVVQAAAAIGPSLLVIDKYADPKIRTALPDVQVLDADSEAYRQIVAKKSNYRNSEKLSPDDIATMVFTSGTTGTPKIIPFEQGIYLRSITQIIRNIDLDVNRKSPDKLLIGTPLDRVGYTRLQTALMGGATIIIPEKYEAAHFLQLIDQYQVSLLHIFPSMLIDMLDVPDRDRYNTRSLTSITYGAEIMPAKKAEEAIRFFGPILQQGYASSEAFPPVSIMQPKDVIKNGEINFQVLTSVGRVAKGVSVKIMDAQYKELPQGAIGEIVVKSSTLFKGYWKNTGSTENSYVDGHFKTGDMGYIFNGNWLYVIGRNADIIQRDGHQIYPRLIEEIVHDYPNIKECVLVTANDKLVLAVSLRKGNLQADADTVKTGLMSFLQPKLQPHELPDSIEVFDEIPRSSVSKILRREVRTTLTEK